MQLLRSVLVIFLVVVMPIAAKADEDSFVTQLGLILEGHYAGPADGIIGPRSREAIAAFQSQIGEAATGRLTASQHRILHAAFANRIAELDIIPVLDQTSDVWLYLPLSYLDSDAATARGFRFTSEFANLELETVRISTRERSFNDLFERLSTVPGRQVAYSSMHPEWFVITGVERERQFYTRFYTNGFEHRGFSIAYDRHGERELNPVVVFISETFLPFLEPPDDVFPVPDGLLSSAPPYRGPNSPELPGHADYPEGRSDDSDIVLYSGGSGFYANQTGLIVTNAHVVHDCRAIETSDGDQLTIRHLDRSVDIALLQGPDSEQFLRVANDSLNLGEDIIALGFPFADILEDGLRVSGGIVSGLSGMRGENTHFTFTAPIQPGNSGGPILNRSGEVVGIVVARLSEQPMLESGEPLPQNVNFGIRREVLHMVFDIAGLEPVAAQIKGGRSELSTADVTSLASDAVVQIVCIH